MSVINLTSLSHILILPRHLIHGDWRRVRSQDYSSCANLQSCSETGVIDWMGKPTFSTAYKNGLLQSVALPEARQFSSSVLSSQS